MQDQSKSSRHAAKRFNWTNTHFPDQGHPEVDVTRFRVTNHGRL